MANARARHFIRQYACQGIKTDQVANYVGISRSSLESHFRQQVGYSVHDEILRARLNAATGMLTQGDCSLADVALKCGFTSSQYMHLVFKRELGCSPRGYQQRVRDMHEGVGAAAGAPDANHDTRDHFASQPASRLESQPFVERRPEIQAA